MEAWQIAISIVAVVITLVGAAVMATWVAGKVQATTLRLGEKIDSLQHAIERLTDKLDGYDDRMRDLESDNAEQKEQIATLQREVRELRMAMNGNLG